jgi:hypothetical protein
VGRITREDAVKLEGRRGKHLEESRLLDAIGVTHIVVRSAASARRMSRRRSRTRAPAPRSWCCCRQTCCRQTRAPRPRPVSLSPISLRAPEDSEISAVADLLEATFMVKRPVILVGQGAISARDELVRLAERIGALLATTLKARMLFHGVLTTSAFAARTPRRPRRAFSRRRTSSWPSAPR